MIKVINGQKHYYDKHGTEITEHSFIKYPSGRVNEIFRTTEGDLGTDATNPLWIEKGRAFPGEWGIYPLMVGETDEVEVVPKP